MGKRLLLMSKYRISNIEYRISKFRIRKLIFVIIMTCALAGNATAQTADTTNITGKSTIQSIQFVNNKSFKDKVLKKKLDFEVGGFLDPVLAESGRRILSEFYYQKGFADVQVTLDKAKLSEGNIVYTFEEGPRYRIKSITFKGNKVLSTGQLRNVIKTKSRKWVLWPVYYTEEKLAADVENLRTIYYQEGFLDNNIKVSGRTNITFEINEGPRYRIKDIIITGNEYFDSEKLLSGLKLKPGGIYYMQLADAHAKQILKLYGENGFVDAQVSKHARFISEPNMVDLEFKITEGRQFRIGRIEITGNEQTQDKVIRRVLDEYDFTPGKLYNASLAPVQGNGPLENDVQMMTMADEVIIKPTAPSGPAKDKLDVQVDIKEGLTGLWSPGIAVGSDSGVVGQLIFEQRNFDITDWPDSLGDFITMQSFKGAGQSLQVRLEPGTEVSSYSVVFNEPYFRDKPTSLNITGSSFERWRECYNEHWMQGFVGFEKRYKDHWTRSIGFRIKNVDVSDIDLYAPQEIYDVEGDNTMYSVRFGFGKDMRDNRYTPSSGYQFEVEYEQFTGDHTFGILQGTWLGYKTVYQDLLERKTVLACKLLGATTSSDAPVFEKFYAGGTGLYGISGFDYRGISTRGLQTNVWPFRIPRRIDPIGSDWIFLADAEVTIPLVGENLSGLLFIDSGTIDSGRYRASLGTGIQIAIPRILGTTIPMRFEIAWPFSKDDSDETRAFSFTMGGLF